MKNKTRSMIVIHFNDIISAERMLKTLKNWSDMAGTGGDSSILYADGYKGTGKEQVGTICGVVGHDVDIKAIDHVIIGE